jgi:hypothetical protein
MRLNRMASLGLLLLAAAAAPRDPCGPGGTAGSTGQSLGAPRDSGFAAASAMRDSCDASAAEPSDMQRMRPDNQLDDAIHALPPSESLRPVEQPRRAPDFR